MGVWTSKYKYYFVSTRLPQTTTIDWIATEDAQIKPANPKTLQTFQPIAKGQYGHIFLCIHVSSQKYCVVKYVSKEDIFNGKKAENIQKEINILTTLKNKFVVRPFTFFETNSCIAMVFEYVYGGSLASRIDKLSRLEEMEAKFYFSEITCVLHYLHDTVKIVHRDIRPENFLIDHNGHLKLCGFGSCISFDTTNNDPPFLNVQQEVDLPDIALYWAPEQVALNVKIEYITRLDWWSAGCILLEMLLGSIPDINLHSSVLRLPIYMKSSIKKLLHDLLERNPIKRLDWEGVMSSSWLIDVDWDYITNHRIIPPWIPVISTIPAAKYFNFEEDLIDPNSEVDPKVDYYCKKINVPSSRKHSQSSKTIEEKRKLSLKKLDEAIDGIDSKEKYRQKSVALPVSTSNKEDIEDIEEIKLKSPPQTSPRRKISCVVPITNVEDDITELENINLVRQRRCTTGDLQKTIASEYSLPTREKLRRAGSLNGVSLDNPDPSMTNMLPISNLSQRDNNNRYFVSNYRNVNHSGSVKRRSVTIEHVETNPNIPFKQLPISSSKKEFNYTFDSNSNKTPIPIIKKDPISSSHKTSASRKYVSFKNEATKQVY